MKIKIKRRLKEISAMSGGAVQGYAGSPLASKEENEKFNKKQEDEQRLKGQKLTEMYSSSALSGRNKRPIVSPEDEHAGHVERSKHQGLKNVMESDDETATVDVDAQANKPTELSNFGSNLQDLSPTARKAVTDAGYKFVDYLGGGQFGKVFKVKNPAMNREEAMKIVTGTPNSTNREVRNYDLIQKARKKSEVIAKHFPETYASWQQEGFGFIAMEILEPVANASDAFLVDRHNILSRDTKSQGIAVGAEIEAHLPTYRDFKDQSKKAAMWFTTEFMDSLKGASTFIEMDALLGIQNPPDLDYSDLLIEISPASMKGLKAQSDMNNPSFQNKVDDHLNMFLSNEKDLPKIANILKLIKKETSGAPYVAVGVAMIANVIMNIRGRAFQKLGVPIQFADLDKLISNRILQYIQGYREFSTMRLGYDKKGPSVETGSARETWDKIAKELYDLTGLVPRDVHYGNVMQRPSGDLVIVDLGLFKMKGDTPGLFESKKYKLKILRK